MDIPRITPTQVADRIRGGEHVVFLDSRSGNAWEQATERIPGSIRLPPTEIDAHASEVPAAPLVVSYCT